MSYWSKLSMKDRADVMKLFLDNGISDLDTMRREYNTFAEGGSVVTSDLLDRVTQEEGFEPHPVDIGDGKMTLGSGLTSKEWRDLYEKRGRKWSQEDNRRAVQTELMRREQWAEKNVPNWNILPDSSKKALLSYKYNYDFTKTNSPKLFQALESGNFREAAKQIDATSKNPKFKKGLTDRRKREQEWFLADIIGNETPAATSTTPVETPTTIGISMPSITEPAVSTAVRNNYVPATTTPYNRGNNMRRGFESVAAYNRMMDATSLQNNPLPEYQFPIEYANGGKIHIKPSHRGRLTELKKRTGKSEAELYNDGNPAHKKMVVFARNARKWKHGLGGNLFDGTTEDSQQMVNPYKPNGGFYYINSQGQPVNPTTRDIIELPNTVVAVDRNAANWAPRTKITDWGEDGFSRGTYEGLTPLVMSESEWNRSHSANDLQRIDPYGEIPWNAAAVATSFLAPELAYPYISKGAELLWRAGEKGLGVIANAADDAARYVSPSYDLYRTIGETPIGKEAVMKSIQDDWGYFAGPHKTKFFDQPYREYTDIVGNKTSGYEVKTVKEPAEAPKQFGFRVSKHGVSDVLGADGKWYSGVREYSGQRFSDPIDKSIIVGKKSYYEPESYLFHYDQGNYPVVQTKNGVALGRIPDGTGGVGPIWWKENRIYGPETVDKRTIRVPRSEKYEVGNAWAENNRDIITTTDYPLEDAEFLQRNDLVGTLEKGKFYSGPNAVAEPAIEWADAVTYDPVIGKRIPLGDRHGPSKNSILWGLTPFGIGAF